MSFPLNGAEKVYSYLDELDAHTELGFELGDSGLMTRYLPAQ